MPERIFYKKRAKYFVLFSIMLSLCILLFYQAQTTQTSWKTGAMYLIGSIGLLFFGLAGIFFLIQLLRSPIGLTLTEQGFIDRSSASSKEVLIPWKGVREIRLVNFMGQNFVTVYLKDEEAYLQDLNFYQRWLLKSNLKMNFGPINIVADALKGIQPYELDDLMKDYHKLYR